MSIEIKIPRLGWSMEEGIFSGWLKKEGEQVKPGEPLFTLEGEKASQDIESTDSGTLRIPKDSPQNGATVKVGQVIGHLVGKEEVIESDETPVKGSAAGAANPRNGLKKVEKITELAPPPKPKQEIVEKAVVALSSPRARRRAAQLGVEVLHLQGSGSRGRIIEADVVKASSAKGALANPNRGSIAFSLAAEQITTMRRNIAERTSLSFSQIPHFYLRAELDATELIKTREHLVGILQKELGVRITLTDFILRAQALALREFPTANAVWQGNGILTYTDADIGVVVSLKDGLVIPMIRAAQNLSLIQLAKERVRLVEGVREGHFNAEMLAGGATSISNLGTTRIDEFAAIIAPHQSSMLAVGRAAPRPYVVAGRLEIRNTMKLCLSVDHRVLDGSPAADFLSKVVELLENPQALIEAV